MKYREVLRKPIDPPAAAPLAETAGAANRPTAPLAKSVPVDRSIADAGGQAEDRADPHILQVASMKDGAAATALVEKLKQQGYPAYRESIEIPDKGVWYRVRVGAYPDRETAEAVQSQMGAVAQNAMVIRK